MDMDNENDHQDPFFELLGTPDEHKSHHVFDAGHIDFPKGAYAKAILDWLDRYLGATGI